MTVEVSITKVLENPDLLLNSHCNGFYDWFCKESSLPNKAKTLLAKFKKIANSKRINKDYSYLWFKNNCPMDGSLYDDFRISDIESGDVIFTVIPKSGHKSKNGIGEVWGRENGFDGPLFQGSWKEIIEWFNKD